MDATHSLPSLSSKGQIMSAQIIALSSLRRAMRFGAGCLSEQTYRAAAHNKLVSNRPVEIIVTYPIGVREYMMATRTMYGKMIVPAAAEHYGYEISA